MPSKTAKKKKSEPVLFSSTRPGNQFLSVVCRHALTSALKERSSIDHEGSDLSVGERFSSVEKRLVFLLSPLTRSQFLHGTIFGKVLQ